MCDPEFCSMKITADARQYPASLTDSGQVAQMERSEIRGSLPAFRFAACEADHHPRQPV
jgi:hypothetical protein